MPIIKLFKRSALGIYEYELILSKQPKGYIISCTHGQHNSKKVSYYVEGDDKKFTALIREKKKAGYRTLEELGCGPELNYAEIDHKLGEYVVDLDNYSKPMKCKPFVVDKFKYLLGTKGQPKINGNRGTIRYGEIPNGLFSTKGVILKSHDGIVLSIRHIEKAFEQIFKYCSKDIVFDGEFYYRDTPVTTISGACRNPKNPVHDKLQFHCFDLAIPDVNQLARLELKHEIFRRCEHLDCVTIQRHPSDHKELNTTVIDVCDQDVMSDIEASEYRELCLKYGYEGCVIRNPVAEYRFGMRPTTMMKLKKPKFAKFEVIDVTLFGFEGNTTNIGKGCKFILKNDINDLSFEIIPEGKLEQKMEYYKNRKGYIGNLVNVRYFERSSKGQFPFHANIIF